MVLASPRRAVPRYALIALVVVTAALVTVPVFAKDVPQYTIEDFLATINMRGADFSPDGSRILVTSDASGVLNAWTVPVAGGAPVQLTHSTTNAIAARAWYPKDDRFLYTSDQGGNELTHVYVQSPDGTVKDVTPGATLKAEFVGWAHDDATFYVMTNERDKRYFDLYQVDPEGFGRTLVYQNDAGHNVAAISRDGRLIALHKTNGEHDSDIFLYDRQTKETRKLTEHQGSVQWDAEAFAADGKGLYMTTNEGHEFAHLIRMDLASGKRETIAKPSWDVLGANLSKSGRYLVVRVNADARTELSLLDVQNGHKSVALPNLPAGEIENAVIADDDRQVALYLNGSRAPSNLYVCEVGGKDARRLTQNLSSKIDPEALVEAEVVRFKSFDGVEVPGILYKPHQASKSNKVPALVNVHGGPGGQSRVGYSGLVQYLVNHGYVVYSINNRGSSGYGKTFYKLDDRKHGDTDLGDCVASKKMLVATGVVDPDRIGIMGGSYGGYMVLAALAFRPQEFALGVDIFGVSNWLRTLQEIPSWWESQRRALVEELGDPVTDEAALRAKSPLFHAKNIQRPLLVLQGKNDPRVKQIESDEIVAAVKANNVPVEYIIFPDEGHGFRNKRNQLQGYKAILDFCDKYLAAGADVGRR